MCEVKHGMRLSDESYNKKSSLKFRGFVEAVGLGACGFGASVLWNLSIFASVSYTGSSLVTMFLRVLCGDHAVCTLLYWVQSCLQVFMYFIRGPPCLHKFLVVLAHPSHKVCAYLH